ncbi:MAG TPA: tyrosine-type recombinase/integrase [Anaerolineae bacterium]|nr:tyrosine-type recombinase/integrase [Anaerolineae bacterium]
MGSELAQTQTELGLAVEQPKVASWGQMIGAFLDTCNAASTRQTYEHKLRDLPRELGGEGPLDVTGQQLAAWSKGIRDQVEAGEVSPNAGKLKVMAVKSLFRFARMLGQSRLDKDMRSVVLRAPREQVVKPFQVLSEAEQDQLLAALKGQDRRIVATLLYAGLRVSELTRLNLRDYYTDEQGRRWLKVSGKGSKDRVVPVGDKLAAELGAPTGGNGEPLFEGRQGRYSRERAYQIVTEAVKRAELDKRITPHSLRHTAAITWLRARVPLTVISKWLGHSGLEPTKRYLDHMENGEAHGYMP